MALFKQRQDYLESRILLYDPSLESESQRKRRNTVKDKLKHVKLVTSAFDQVSKLRMDKLVNARFLKIEDEQMYEIDTAVLRGKFLKYLLTTVTEIIKGIVKNYVCEVFIEQSRKTQ